MTKELQGYKQIIAEHFPELRKDCPCLADDDADLNCEGCYVTRHEGFAHVDQCTPCRGKGYIADFTLEELMRMIPIIFSFLANKKYRARAFCDSRYHQLFDNSDPMVAACGAVVKAIQAEDNA